MDDAPAKSAVIRFGEFELDLRTAQLRAAGVLTRLQPQPAKVLALLASNRGNLVSREQIRQQIWGAATFVDFEQGLNFCIRQIRTALGDDADCPRFIETLPRRGYRFVAAVEAAPASPAPPVSALRIALMPFEHIGADAEQDYFSEGLTEEMTTALSRLAPGRLRVIARATMLQCRREGMDLARLRREMRIDYLLEGNVRRSSDRVRIAIQLTDLNDQTLMWAETYERRLTDLFAIQAEVAARVARSLALELLPGAPAPVKSATRSPAHEAYLKGRYFWHKITAESLLASSRYFEEAIAADPGYAPAYAGLADCYAQMGSVRVALLTSAEAAAKAKPMAARALDLDDALPEAHNALALIKCWYEWDWDGAGREFRRALALDPDSVTHAPWYGMYLIAIGEPEKALAEIHRAREIDPLSPILNTYVGAIQLNVGQYDLAVRHLRDTIPLETSYYRPYFFLGLALRGLGRYAEAFSALHEAHARTSENMEVAGFIGQLQADTGDREGAIATVNRLIALRESRFDPALLIAMIYAGLGEIDTAFAWVDRAIERRTSPIYLLRLSSMFEGLQGDPRYRSCLLRIGLPPFPAAVRAN